LDVGDEGVVERVAEPDEGPDGHDHSGRVGELFGGEEGFDVVKVDLL
jgi:hypothetical protein